jgi:hypothetical protein
MRAVLAAALASGLLAGCATTKGQPGTPGSVPRDGYGQPIG